MYGILYLATTSRIRLHMEKLTLSYLLCTVPSETEEPVFVASLYSPGLKTAAVVDIGSCSTRRLRSGSSAIIIMAIAICSSSV